jgi:glycosyltransferase involved in cell wall biosynthesis
LKKSVVIRAPLLSCSGYGVHSRQIFKWLIGRDDFNVFTQVVQWGMTPWLINPESENGIPGEVMKRSGSPEGDEPYDISFQVQLPDEWSPDIAKFNVGISAVVETLTCNPTWIDGCNKMDMVIVPSRHAKKCLENTGSIKTPIFVVPESFIEEIEDPTIEPLDIDLDTSFNFLIFGQMTGNNPDNDRKNIFNTLKWMCEVFKDDPDVGIVLKTNQGTGTKIDRNLTMRTVENLISAVRKGPYPRIHMLHGNMSAKEVASLYRREDVKCMVSLTRGEGYGLPLLEASASDIPVIVTNWSGHLDFMKKGKFIPVDFNLNKVHSTRIDNRIFLEGMMWAEPDEKDFKEKVLRFRKKSTIPKEWAVELGKTLRGDLSQREICKKYDSALKKAIGI